MLKNNMILHFSNFFFFNVKVLEYLRFRIAVYFSVFSYQATRVHKVNRVFK